MWSWAPYWSRVGSNGLQRSLQPQPVCDWETISYPARIQKKKISFIGDQIQTLSALYNIWGNFKNAGNSKCAVKSVAEKYITVKRVWGRMVV